MNREEKPKKVTLHEPEQAVSSYLDALLNEIDEAPAQQTKTKPKRANVVEIRPTVTTTVVQAVEIPEPADTPVVEVAQEQQADAQEGVINEIVVPEWANQPFQALFFKVRGMTLGIPLVALDSIAEWSSELTSLPGQQEWNLGVLVHREQRVVVVDTAQLIAPERLSAAEESRQSSHVLMVGDGKWGLACDSIQNPQILDKESVRWRRGAGLQPWMAGTVIDQLCILLDVDALLEIIGHK